jgi:hypothetical protein
MRFVEYPYPVDSPEYQQCHNRARREFGKASSYLCNGEDCAKRAHDWAWVHDTDPWEPENYIPLCRACHQDYDRAEWLVEERKRERARIANTGAYKGWTPERREAQRQRMLGKWNQPGEREAQADRARRDRPWTGRRPKRGGGAR